MNNKILESFRILELEPDASLDQVKKAWRQLAMVWHPDRFPSDSALQHKAQEKLKAINNAYEILEEYFKSGEAQQFRDSSEQSTATDTDSSTEPEDDPPQDDSRSHPQAKKSRQIIILLLSVIALSMLAVIVILIKKQASANRLVAKVPVENKFHPSETGGGKVYMPPVITQQPKNQSAYAGIDVTFNVAVSGVGPFSYQWQFNGTNLPNIGIITTVAGNGLRRYSGDGGAATDARLEQPDGVAVDASGNLFIADTGNQRIRKVSTNGIITTVAGSGRQGYDGDGGAATHTALSLPSGVAVDASGNLFIADSCNNSVRKVSTNGIITTVAGGTQGYSGDGDAATNATLYNPTSVAVDTSGNLFISDNSNRRIRKVSASGIITTVAGNGRPGYSGDGGAAINASLYDPTSVAVDTSGNLFIADHGHQRIRKVSANGIITTVAGNGTQGYSGDGGAATDAKLSLPNGVVVDARGNLFISDSHNHRIRKVSTNGIITTVAGNGTIGYDGDDGAATDAELRYPNSVAVDTSGNLFISDYGNTRIRKVDLSDQPNLNLTSVRSGMAGNYSVIVTGAGGSITSSVAKLTLLPNNARLPGK